MTRNKGYDNITPLSERTPEERREIQSKGGKAKAAAERNRKAIRDTFNELLDIRDYNAPWELIINDTYNINFPEDSDLRTRLCGEILLRALRGNMKAAEIVLKYVENPRPNKE